RAEPPRSHRLPHEPAGPGPPHASAERGGSQAAARAAHQARPAARAGLTGPPCYPEARRSEHLTQAPPVPRRLQLPASSDLLTLLGKNDEHLRALESQFDLRVSARGHGITLPGERGAGGR